MGYWIKLVLWEVLFMGSAWLGFIWEIDWALNIWKFITGIVAFSILVFVLDQERENYWVLPIFQSSRKLESDAWYWSTSILCVLPAVMVGSFGWAIIYAFAALTYRVFQKESWKYYNENLPG